MESFRKRQVQWAGLISDLHRRPNETKAAEALVETFQAAAHAMARHQQSMEQQLRNLDTAKG